MYQPRNYATVSTIQLMKISADLNAEWRLRNTQEVGEESEIGKALMVKSPGQLEVELSIALARVKALEEQLASIQTPAQNVPRGTI